MRLICCLSVALAAASAHAAPKTQRYEKAGVEFTVPDGWKLRTDGAVMSVNSPDGVVVMLFLGVEQANIDQTLKSLDKVLLDAGVREADIGNTSESTLNGMQVLLSEGTAKVGETKIEVGILLANPKKPRALIAIGMSPAGGSQKNEAKLGELVQSIKPLKK